VFAMTGSPLAARRECPDHMVLEKPALQARKRHGQHPQTGRGLVTDLVFLLHKSQRSRKIATLNETLALFVCFRLTVWPLPIQSDRSRLRPGANVAGRSSRMGSRRRPTS
jgi:hypothetical protein